MDERLQSPFELQLAAYSAKLHAFLERLPGRLQAGRLTPLGDECKVHPAQVQVEELEMLLGAGSVAFTGR